MPRFCSLLQLNKTTPALAVPPKKAFPMTATASGRVSATRADVNAGVLNITSALDSSMTSDLSGVTVLQDSIHGIRSGPTGRAKCTPCSFVQEFARCSKHSDNHRMDSMNDPLQMVDGQFLVPPRSMARFPIQMGFQ
eukprot:Gb_13489 [translate_table: standard]